MQHEWEPSSLLSSERLVTCSWAPFPALLTLSSAAPRAWSGPCQAYQALAEKHGRVLHEYRKATEEAAGVVVAADEAFRLRDDLADVMARCVWSCVLGAYGMVETR